MNGWRCLDYNSAMKPILAIETSTQTGSVAVLNTNTEPPQCFEGALVQGSGHAESLLPLIDHVLGQAGVKREEIGAVAFGQGPGAFTGIRLGCSVAQGIAFTFGLPVIAVNALLATASAFAAQDAVTLVALDARMNEVYFAVYYGQLELQAPVLMAASDLYRFISPRLPYWLNASRPDSSAILVGEGWQIITQALGAGWFADLNLDAFDDQARPQAREVAEIGVRRWREGKVVSPEMALPLYLRDKVAYTTQERAQGLGGNPKVALSDDLLVLPMLPADLAEVIDLEQRSQAFPWSQRNFEDSLAAAYPAWVIRLDKALVGFCVAMPTPDDIHVLVIAVDPDHRRRRLATRLLELVEQMARDLGLPRMLLEVRPSNHSALAFYRATGFEQIGVRRHYYPAGKGEREDAWVMARPIDDLAL